MSKTKRAVRVVVGCLLFAFAGFTFLAIIATLLSHLAEVANGRNRSKRLFTRDDFFALGLMAAIGIAAISGGIKLTRSETNGPVSEPESEDDSETIVRLTSSAAEHARRILAERGFSPGSGLRIDVSGKGRSSVPDYAISFDDRPVSTANEWCGRSQGLLVLVARNAIDDIEGLVVDYVDGDFLFARG